MTDKPWEHLPPPAPKLEPSRIITPTDTITITIDNRGSAPRATMQCSRELPRVLVIGAFAALIQQLAQEMMMEAMRAFPAPPPGTEPNAGKGGNHAPKA